MKNRSTRTIVSAVLLVALPVFMACFSQTAEAQGLFETGATTGAVGGGAAGAGSGIGGALNKAMGGVANAVGGAASGGGGSADFSGADTAFGVPAANAPTASAPAPTAAADFSGADSAFGGGGAGAPALEAADQATEGDPTIPKVLTPEEQEAEIQKHMTAFMKTRLGSLPPSVISTLTYEQYEAWKRAKAEKYALSNGSYGTANYVPRRQQALEQVIQQAKDMQYSQQMIDEIAKMFRLQEYIDYDYDVRYGRDPSGYLEQLERLKRERQRRADEQKRFNDRLLKIVGGPTKVNPEDDPTFQGPGGGIHQTGPIGPITGGTDDGRGYGPLAEQMKQLVTAMGGNEIPPDVVASLEAAIHNAVLDKLKAKGFNVAALNVFLHNKQEVKVIVIVTTSELPQSAIRSTLRQVRGIIEREVLDIKFKPLRLAQLSSFTILNEVDNHFYEHPVLYWQMQLAGWDSHGRRLTPSTPGVGEQLPQADPTGEGDQMLREFLGN